jgi:hypothetical protein
MQKRLFIIAGCNGAGDNSRTTPELIAEKKIGMKIFNQKKFTLLKFQSL